MDAKIEKLRDWGCNVNDAMERMLDDEEFYIECLETVAEDENYALLKKALDSHDASRAFDCAHTLKGVLANVGLTPMYDKIVEIVEPLRRKSDEDLSGKYAELMGTA